MYTTDFIAVNREPVVGDFVRYIDPEDPDMFGEIYQVFDPGKLIKGVWEVVEEVDKF